MGNYREKPLIDKQTSSKKYKDIAFGCASMCGWRKFMQDSHICSHPISASQQISLFAIFDGHGGPAVALFVQRYFQKQLVRNQHFIKQQYEKALETTFLKMDQLITSKKGYQQIKKIHQQQHMKKNAEQDYQNAGCTANVLLITPTHIYCANAGDARCIASFENNTKILTFSIDHKPNDQREKKRVKAAGGTVNAQGRINGVINVSRSIGDIQYKQNKSKPPQQQAITAFPDVVKHERGQQRNNVDFIIMGCDGIWQKMSNEQMIEWVRKQLRQQKNEEKSVNSDLKQDKSQKLSGIVCRLLDQNMAKQLEGDEYGRDNMSAILIVFDEDRSAFPVRPVNIIKPAIQRTISCPCTIM